MKKRHEGEKNLNACVPYTAHITILSCVMGLCASGVNADFELNFLPDNTGQMSTISQITGCLGTCDGHTAVLLDNGNQLRIGEDVYNPETGKVYKHFIIGDVADGFIQEAYIEIGVETYTNSGETWSGLATGGDYSLGGNNEDPLGSEWSSSGNGTANPNRVIVRQLMSDGVIHQEYIKSAFSKKAKITQTVIDPGQMTSQFEIDASKVLMNQLSTAGTMINMIDLAGEANDFDIASLSGDGVDINVNAGQYIYLDGAGSGGSSGIYLYLDGGENVRSTDWSSYYDLNETNPWSVTDRQPQ